MLRFPTIHYLRWARAQALPPYPEIALNYSGMPAPDLAPFGAVPLTELLAFHAQDHPPLAYRLAEAWHVPPERVLVQPGTHGSLQLMIAARLQERPGAVLVEDPAYEPLWRIAEGLGAPVHRVRRLREAGFAFDPESLDRAAAQNPSILVLTHLHNPSGVPLTGEDVRLLSEFQRRTGCAILSDEVYVEFLPDHAERSLLRQLEDVAVVRSFTKVFGLGGVRCTASIARLDWIARAAAITDHGAVHLPAPSQALAVRLWEHRESLWQRARAMARAGRAEVQPWLERLGDHVEARLPEAGIICFPRVSETLHQALLRAAQRRGVQGPFGYGLDERPDESHVWVEDIRRECGVQLVAGGFFGDGRAFRLGFGVDPARLREGLDRVERHFRSALEEA